MRYFKAAADDFFMQKCKRPMRAPSWTAFMPHAILNIYTKPLIEIGYIESKMSAFICTCRPFAHYATRLATQSSYFNFLSARLYVQWSSALQNQLVIWSSTLGPLSLSCNLLDYNIGLVWIGIGIRAWLVRLGQLTQCWRMLSDFSLMTMTTVRTIVALWVRMIRHTILIFTWRRGAEHWVRRVGVIPNSTWRVLQVVPVWAGSSVPPSWWSHIRLRYLCQFCVGWTQQSVPWRSWLKVVFQKFCQRHCQS